MRAYASHAYPKVSRFVYAISSSHSRVGFARSPTYWRFTFFVEKADADDTGSIAFVLLPPGTEL